VSVMNAGCGLEFKDDSLMFARVGGPLETEDPDCRILLVHISQKVYFSYRTVALSPAPLRSALFS